MIRETVFLFGLVAVTGALEAQAPVGPWKSERARRGDTTVVRTLSGSVWGEKVALVEELRIGSKEGDGPDSFGFIQCLAVLPDGVMAVFDGSVPALRLFDPAGKHLRTLGRDGAGPGEYRNQCLGLVVDRDRVLVMYDPRNARLNRWKEDGTLLPSWRAPGRLFTDQALQIDTTGHLYVKITTAQPEPGKEWKIALLTLGGSGEVADTVFPPAIAGEAPPSGTFFSPRKEWHLNRAGAMVSGNSAQYALTVAGSGSGPIRLERAVERVALFPDERAAYQEIADSRRNDPMVRADPASPSVPGVKPFWRSIQSDLDSRIWVGLHGVGERYDPPPQPHRPGMPSAPPLKWRERRGFDVFESNGRYLGRVGLPDRTTFYEARGDKVWAVQRGDDDEQYIVRYRITGMR